MFIELHDTPRPLQQRSLQTTKQPTKQMRFFHFLPLLSTINWNWPLRCSCRLQINTGTVTVTVAAKKTLTVAAAHISFHHILKYVAFLTFPNNAFYFCGYSLSFGDASIRLAGFADITNTAMNFLSVDDSCHLKCTQVLVEAVKWFELIV